jgi:hypothetical protein
MVVSFFIIAWGVIWDDATATRIGQTAAPMAPGAARELHGETNLNAQ